MEKSILKSALLFLYTVQHESVSSFHDFTLSSFWHAFVNNFMLLFPFEELLISAPCSCCPFGLRN